MTNKEPYVEDVRVLTPTDVMEACLMVFQEKPFDHMNFYEQMALTIFAGRVSHYLFKANVKEGGNERD